ncbi:uncharacterized protein METZ01_LOCUS69743, partial [marine metagenome]
KKLSRFGVRSKDYYLYLFFKRAHKSFTLLFGCLLPLFFNAICSVITFGLLFLEKQFRLLDILFQIIIGQ